MRTPLGILLFAAALAAFSGPARSQNITCASEDGQRHYCTAETRAGVALLRQRSGSPCTKDYSWGFDERGIWVDHGCRADFALETRSTRDDRDRSSREIPTVSCSSDDGNRQFCGADTRLGVRLLHLRSDSACTQGYSWDYDDRGIWVDHGCHAEFALRSGPFSPSANISCIRSLGSERAKKLVDQCIQVSPATHPPCNSQNTCSLIIDEIRRSCAILGRDAPGFCAAYRSPSPLHKGNSVGSGRKP
jgi:hypothetical protein